MNFIVDKLYYLFVLSFFSDLVLTPKEFQGSFWKTLLFIFGYPNSFFERQEFVLADCRTVIPPDIRNGILSGDTPTFVKAVSLFRKGLEEGCFISRSFGDLSPVIDLAQYEFTLLCNSAFHGNSEVSQFCKGCLIEPQKVSVRDARRLANLVECIFHIRFRRIRAAIAQILATGAGVLIGIGAGEKELDSAIGGMVIVGIIGFLTGTAWASPNAGNIIAIPTYGCVTLFLTGLASMALGFTGKPAFFATVVFCLAMMVLVTMRTKWNRWMGLELEAAFRKMV